MNNYRLLIQYDGSRYKGWQRLGNGENTIQGKIESVLSEMLGKEVEIIGSSRTDAGVHAFAQVANFKTEKDFAPAEVKAYLNRYLPEDISVVEVTSVPDRFHARYNAKAKTYLYKIWNEEHPHPFMRKYSMHLTEKLDVAKMKEAGQYFVGTHDFTAFSNAKSKKKSSVREIYSVEVFEEDDFIQIRVRGEGFLYNMVRKLAGTLIEAGLGAIAPSSIPGILESKERVQTGRMAEAGGLHLENIEF
ncbi:tRNA pseudouridine(38-40) synthase TruA [Ectobacillus ponti]|uniref:tRNA pseudouridine synthase A n=1 Tax=Ectobacillus ponti TaxID=2961894 RepID=A0AA42BR17_9BACI|nr:tRNA pseudouridine(38-40) synthase TruA [Ectobacillus ponti]MCP8969956.1 tRNA pseudouridine(38-40) synthase TruA [Ectobacillus ponti]